jgi:hypothetical protein
LNMKGSLPFHLDRFDRLIIGRTSRQKNQAPSRRPLTSASKRSRTPRKKELGATQAAQQCLVSRPTLHPCRLVRSPAMHFSKSQPCQADGLYACPYLYYYHSLQLSTAP